MTKEELEEEAYEWTKKNISVGISMYNPSIEMYCGKAYKDGAEPREKRITELEKENKELKTVKIPQLERRIASIRGCHSVDAKKLNARIEQVERLKQENAELREKAAEYKKKFIYKGWSTLCYKDKYDTRLRENTGLKIHNAYVEKKLAEAKDIIRELLNFDIFPDVGIKRQAEQFIKGE